jgi:hypothetical protein
VPTLFLWEVKGLENPYSLAFRVFKGRFNSEYFGKFGVIAGVAVFLSKNRQSLPAIIECNQKLKAVRF